MNRIKILWNDLCSNFWFIPLLVVTLYIVVGIVLIGIDTTFKLEWMGKWPRLFGAGAEGARGMLSTIAGSMMSVVGITFSITIVILSLAASQYSSRVLRNFMSNHTTQFILGSFTGIFTYCLIVLRTIRSTSGDEFVPNLSVFFGVMLVVVGVGILIFFIHHIAVSIQASSIISSIAEESKKTIDHLYPELFDKQKREREKPAASIDRNWFSVLSSKSGFIQDVDKDKLLSLAKDWKAVVKMEHGVGEFVVENAPLLSIAFEKKIDEEKIKSLLSAIIIGRYRTPEQDIAFGIRQLVDIALKALSPGINDTTTAVMCINYLTVILSSLIARNIPSIYCFDKKRLCLILKSYHFEDFISLAFDQIQSNATNNATVILTMLDAIETIASQTEDERRLQALFAQLQKIEQLPQKNLEIPYDRQSVDCKLREVKKSLESKLYHFKK